MATDQDFSFPTINDSCHCSIDSPPLWNLSPASSPNPYEGFIREGNMENKEGQRKSFSCIEIGRVRRDEDDEDNDDEKQKMDLLWEDFNEELSSRATSTSREEVELRTVAKRRNNNAALLLPTKNSNKNNNKPGVVVLVKVLKKLFSLSSSHGKPRKRVLP